MLVFYKTREIHNRKTLGMTHSLRTVHLEDKYTIDQGQIFLTGIQALVRLPLVQKRLDLRQGLNTAGFISGYRGSPLGGFDLALWKAKKHLENHTIHFHPGINEDLAATAVWGSQQSALSPNATVDGVFSMWYGKGPGVDRSGDAFKHANFAGTNPLGGVLALAGDDHACKSSTLPHQTEFAFMDAFMPVMHPATVQDILDLGIYGWALSRYAGVWVCFKMLSDTVDTAASVHVDLDHYPILLPTDFEMPLGGLGLRWPDIPLEQERRMHNFKMKAVPAFIRANTLNKVIWPSSSTQQPSKPRIGFVAVGKGYLDLRQALEDLNIDEAAAHQLGISIYKVVVSWPLEPDGILSFCRGLEQVIVVEEKRSLIETQLKEILFHLPADQRPQVIGKTTETGELFLPSVYELGSSIIKNAIAKRLKDLPGFDRFKSAFNDIANQPIPSLDNGSKLQRQPYYCSGCPHNTSTTQLPEGSRALGGIGCHYMATWIDNRTTTFTHMGGEGVPWIGVSPFTTESHIFSNLGDGTYYHSGLLAIRAAVASGVNITYKILYNDAVAMTGGQPVDGPLTVSDITHQLYAERIRRIAVVTDEPYKYPKDVSFSPGVTVHHRAQLQQVQEELRQIKGTTALIYDQTCAAEKRRRRKRGLMEDPNRRIFINETVCEGCGDCSRKSNCLSVIPITTEWGTKRAIDQSSCNKDYSCVNGFCPSFVSVIGGKIRKPESSQVPEELFANLPEPNFSPLTHDPYDIFITGVGGTGVITIGALIGMAAHLEKKGCSVVDMAGLAQKGGAVVTHLRLSRRPEDIHATRVDAQGANLLLGFDLVVSSGHEALSKVNPGVTQVLINDHQTITGHFTKNPDYIFPAQAMREDVLKIAGQDRTEFIEAQELATNLMGDSIMTNLFMVGYALQKGYIPVSVQALEEAIRLNNVAIEQNLLAFQWGRLAAVDWIKAQNYIKKSHMKDQDHTLSETTDQFIDRRTKFLEVYQNQAYAQDYLKIINRVREKETLLKTDRLTKIIAQTLYRLMAYKDEYEVARLYANGDFKRRLQEQFEGDYKVHFHLAPPLLAKRNEKGELQKMILGPWMLTAFKGLAKLKGLRGSIFDIFGYSQERKRERQLIQDYKTIIDKILETVTPETLDSLCEIAVLPQKIRGYGHIKERNDREISIALNAYLSSVIK